MSQIQTQSASVSDHILSGLLINLHRCYLDTDNKFNWNVLVLVMAQFLDSSQYQTWFIKDPKALRTLREERYEYSVHRIKEKYQAYAEGGQQSSATNVDADASSMGDNGKGSSASSNATSHKRPGHNTDAERPTKRQCLDIDLDFPTLDEELRMLRAYEQKIMRLCSTLKFNPAITATAITFFKRFYLTRSPLIITPDSIMYTVVVLAIKVEACPYTEVSSFIRALAEFVGCEQSEIVQNEMIVLAGINFDLTVHHPFRSLRGLLRLLQMQSNVTAEDIELPPWKDDPWGYLESRAKLFIYHSLTTDAPLLYTPGQLALASLQLAVHRDCKELPSETLKQPVPSCLISKVDAILDQLEDTALLRYAEADSFGNCSADADAASFKQMADFSEERKKELRNKLAPLRASIFEAANEPDLSQEVTHICKKAAKVVDPSMVSGTQANSARQKAKAKVKQQREQEKRAKKEQAVAAEQENLANSGFCRVLFS
eukprot:gb/GECG01014369.1/.p1 GENE.gb/GECG01014369.1/~~gb/GECG01014369.1/.p1  ORF type:complete len:487 (+),score=58.86 gb/GECG01014369.1/:1-1461(+)